MEPSHFVTHANARLELSVGQLELALLVGVIFALLSLIVGIVKGRTAAYFASQLLSFAFILLAVGFLFEKVASARLEDHPRVPHHASAAPILNLPATHPVR